MFFLDLIMIGSRIRGFRNKQKISQQRLADILKVNKSRIGRIERGEVEVTASELLSMSDILKVKVEDILLPSS